MKILTDDFPSFASFMTSSKGLEWTKASHPARKSSMPQAPSFRDGMDRLVRHYHRQATLRGERPFNELINDPRWFSSLVESLNVRITRVLCDDFPLQNLRDALENVDECVVKPVRSYSSRGVMSLRREGELSFFCLQQRCVLRLVNILDQLNAAMRGHQIANHWRLEELLLPPSGLCRPVDDYKFYAIGGQVGLILQVCRLEDGQKYRWYDRDWQPVPTGKYDDQLDHTLLPPRKPEQLSRVARQLSEALPAPFCRIDLYETSHGVVLGELTPVPGTYHTLGADADLYLGAMLEAVWH
jgi:hypothetical protein